MSRQTEQTSEEREKARRVALVKALEFGLVQALLNQGAELQGFSIRYDEFSCLITLRADFNEVRHVCFLYSDSMMNCIIRASSAASVNRLNWQPDKYHKEDI